MGLSGAWLRQTTYLQPMFGRTPPPDPRHAEPGQDFPGEPIWEAPPYAPGGDQLNLYEQPVAGSGEPDHTPVDHAHNRGAYRQGLSEGELWQYHDRDLGADERTGTSHIRLQGADRYETVVYTQIPGPQAGTDLWARRGLNAYPENNPPKTMYAGDGWRQARDTRQFVDHDLSQPQRVPRYHVRTANVAAAATNRPPPAAHGPYNSPFGSLARSIRDRYAKPRMRREPGTLTEGVLLDEPELAGPPASAALAFLAGN